MMKIDAVIPWVDGNDPVLNAKRREYGDTRVFKQDDVAGSTRYASVGEIFWCVASLNRFAPWLNKIYIVTDGQDPNLTPFLEKHFPEGFIPVEIVDHKTIFRGYEEYLPVFNSSSIEPMCWRIPGLSEQYLYLNDDLLLLQPASPSDFFTEDGGIVVRVTWGSVPWIRLKRFLTPKVNGRKRMSFRWMMVQTALAMGERKRYMKLYHTPRGLVRSFYENFYREHPELLIRNIRYKFRDDNHFNVNELQYLGMYRQGKCKILPPDDYVFYIYPKSGRDYMLKKMEILKNGNFKCCCFNSLDRATPEDMKIVLPWIEKQLGL